MLADTLRPGPYDAPFAAVTNPFGLGSRSALKAVDFAGWLLVVAGLGAGAAALVVRLRRARDVERRQLKLVLAVAAFAATGAAALMATWFIWPSGHLQARIAVLGVLFALVPLAAGVAILRHRLYDIDVVIDRTLVYAAVTVVLAAAFAGTNLLLGTALGGGSAWPTAAATLLVAVAFRPLRARVQDGLDRRFHRARYTALRRMADFLEDLRAGRAAPEAVEGVLRERVRRPAARAPLPGAGERGLRRRTRAAGAGGRTGTRGSPSSATGSRIALVLHAPAGEDRVALLRQVVAAGGLAIEIARLRVELRRRLAEVETSRARIVTAANEERRRIERDLHDGAQQRLVSIGLALRHAQHQLGGAAPERREPTLDGAVAEIADGDRRAARARPRTAARAAGRRARAGAARAGPPRPRAGRARRGPGALRPRLGGRRLLHRLRGPDQRRQARPARRRSCSARRATTATSSCPWPTTAGRRGAGPGLRPRRPRRPRRRARRHAAHRQPARGHDPHRGAAVRVVIVEDQVLLREGLARLFEDGGHEVIGVAGRRRRPAGRDRGAPPRPRGARHPHAADVHRRGRPRGPSGQADPSRARRAPALPAHRDQPCRRPRRARRLRLPAQGPGARRRRVPRRSRARRPRRFGARSASRRRPRLPRGADDPLDELTDREAEVLELMAEGLTNTGIAKRLYLSERTVEAHVRHVLMKLDLPEDEDRHRRVLAVLAHREHAR